jgi:hypothetical protein
MKPFHLAIIIAIVFLLLPTANSTVDAIGYAGDMKWGVNLFAPHHLLYNAFGWLLYKLLGLDVLPLMKGVNALTAGISVFVLGKILERRDFEKGTILGWMLFVGGSFGVMRFATDNEAYLIPVLLSLLASLVFLYQEKNQRWLLIAGFLAALACLFHQLHVWWWLGLLIAVIRQNNRRGVFFYLLPTLIVPLAYVAVLWAKQGDMPKPEGILSFVFNDFARDEVGLGFSAKGLILTPISLFRTFFQVHGSVFLFLEKMPWLWMAVALAVAGIGKGLFRKWPIHFFNKQTDFFTRSHLYILLFHFLFAMLSQGNAEFMVMIPFLLPLASGRFFEIHKKTVLWLGIACWIWNLSLAIIPGHFLPLFDDQSVAEQLVNYPEAHFIFADKHQVANRYFYMTGESLHSRIHNWEEVDSLCNQGETMITDIPDRPTLFSRMVFMTYIPDYSFWKQKQLMALEGFAGRYGLWLFRCEKRVNDNDQ